MNRPKITVTPVPHIKRVDLLRDLSLRQIHSLDSWIKKECCASPSVDDPKDVSPWEYLAWKKFYDSEIRNEKHEAENS